MTQRYTYLLCMYDLCYETGSQLVIGDFCPGRG